MKALLKNKKVLASLAAVVTSVIVTIVVAKKSAEEVGDQEIKLGFATDAE